MTAEHTEGNTGAADPATETPGEKPKDVVASAKPTPEPELTGSITIDGETFTAAQTRALIAKLNGEAQKHRQGKTKAEEQLAALQAVSKKARDTELAKQGKFETLHSELKASIDSRNVQVMGVIASNALKAALVAQGLTDSVLKHVALPTGNIIVDSDTLTVTGVDDVVAELMKDLAPLIAAKADTPPAATSKPSPVEIKEHRREDSSSVKTMKVADITAYAADVLKKAGVGA